MLSVGAERRSRSTRLLLNLMALTCRPEDKRSRADRSDVLRTAAVIREEPQRLGILHDRNLARTAADENSVKVFGAIGEGCIWSNSDARIRHHQVSRLPHEANICGHSKSCLGTKQVHQGQAGVQ